MPYLTDEMSSDKRMMMLDYYCYLGCYLVNVSLFSFPREGAPSVTLYNGDYYFLNYLQWSLFPKDNIEFTKQAVCNYSPALLKHSINEGVITWVFLQAEIPTVLTSSQDVDYAVSNRGLPVPRLSPP